MSRVCLPLTFAKTSGETSSSVVQSFPFLFPTDWRHKGTSQTDSHYFLCIQKYKKVSKKCAIICATVCYYTVWSPRTRSFMSRSLTMKLATMDFIGDANWSGASMEMWPRDTRGVMSCSGTSAFRLRDRGWGWSKIKHECTHKKKDYIQGGKTGDKKMVYSAS